jgi:hypothetical protein
MICLRCARSPSWSIRRRTQGSSPWGRVPLLDDPEKWEPVFRKDHPQSEQDDPEKWEPVFRKDHPQSEQDDPEKWEPVFRKDHPQSEQDDPEK